MPLQRGAIKAVGFSDNRDGQLAENVAAHDETFGLVKIARIEEFAKRPLRAVQVRCEENAGGFFRRLPAKQRHTGSSTNEAGSMQDFVSIGKLDARGYNRRKGLAVERLFILMGQSPNPPPAAGMGLQDQAEREKFEAEVRRIIEAGNAAGLTLRLLGSLAFQFHCPPMGFLQAQMGRAYTDIDFAGYSRQANGISTALAELGYQEDR